MNVLFICGAGLFSGLEKVTLSIMQGLQRENFSVSALMSNWGAAEFSRRLEELHIPYFKLRIGFISKKLTLRTICMTLDQIVRLPGLWWGYASLLRRTKPAIVVHTNFHHITVLFPFLRPSREVFYVHNCFAPSAFYRHWFKIFSPRIALVICVSNAVAESLEELGVPKEKLRIVHNGVLIPSAMVLNKSSHEPCDRINIGIVGQVGEWKGHHVLINALDQIRRQGLNVHCSIIGEGDNAYKEKIRLQISSLKLNDCVTWRGFVSGLDDIYKGIDICVVPSLLIESFGLAAAEPMAYGIPVVASAIGGLKEVVVNAETGYLVEPGDVEELSRRLTDLIINDSLRIKFGKAARLYAEQNFAEHIMVNHFCEALNSIS